MVLENISKTFMEFTSLRHLKDINCTNSLVTAIFRNQLQMAKETSTTDNLG